MEEVKLSICIPTYNRKEQLKKQIEFFIDEEIQNYNCEIWISDNASTDGTKEYLQEISKSVPCVKVNYNNTNCGMINNFMKLVDLANGEYLWIVGDDDLLVHGILNAIMKKLYTYNNLSLLVCNALFSDDEQELKKERNGLEKYEGYYKKGLSLFSDIVQEPYKLGLPMYITANVHLRTNAQQVNKIYMESREIKNENLALPLGYTFYSALQGGAYFVSDIYIKDDNRNISWGKNARKVFARDQIAILDIVCKHCNLKLLECIDFFECINSKYPEFEYMKGHYNADNYAMKFFVRNCPLRIIGDMFKIVISRVKCRIKL